MTSQQIYIAISLAALAAILLILILKGKKIGQAKPSRMAALSFVFVLAGIIFGDDRIIGYGLLAIGIILAIIDIIKRRKQRK